MTTQVWGMLGSSKIIFDRTEGDTWKVTVPYLESGEYIVALYAEDVAGNQAYVATILYVVDVEHLRYEIKMMDYAAEVQANGFDINVQMQDYSIEEERLEGRRAYFAEDI